jgi:hypothetical protein
MHSWVPVSPLTEAVAETLILKYPIEKAVDSALATKRPLHGIHLQSTPHPWRKSGSDGCRLAHYASFFNDVTGLPSPIKVGF